MTKHQDDPQLTLAQAALQALDGDLSRLGVTVERIITPVSTWEKARRNSNTDEIVFKTIIYSKPCACCSEVKQTEGWFMINEQTLKELAFEGLKEAATQP